MESSLCHPPSLRGSPTALHQLLSPPRASSRPSHGHHPGRVRNLPGRRGPSHSYLHKDLPVSCPVSTYWPRLARSLAGSPSDATGVVRRQAYSRHAFPSQPTTNHWHRLGSSRPQPAGSKLAAHHRPAHADRRLHPGIPRLLAMQRIYHRPLTVQHTSIVLPATAHRTSAARLQDRSLSAWGNNHYRGVIGALLPSVVAGSLPRRYTQEQQPTSRHTTVQIHLRYAAHSCCLHPAHPTGAHRDRFRKLQQVHEPLLPDRRSHHCSWSWGSGMADQDHGALVVWRLPAVHPNSPGYTASRRSAADSASSQRAISINKHTVTAFSRHSTSQLNQ